MEPRFTALRVIQKKDDLDLAAFLRKKMTGWRKFLKIFLFVIMLLCLPACILSESGTWNLITAIVLILYVLFFDCFHGLHLYRIESRSRAAIELHFYDDHLQVVDSLADSTYLYAGVVALHETPHQFLLQFPAKRYILVPKSSLPAGQVDAFRDFIAQQCGKPCQPCPIRPAWRWVWLGVCCVLLVLSLIGSYILNHQPQTFVRDNYSITLPEDFIGLPENAGPADYYFASQDVVIIADFSDGPSFLGLGETLVLYDGKAEAYEGPLYAPDAPHTYLLDNGVCCTFADFPDFAESYYCYAILPVTDTTNCITTFVFPKTNESLQKYQPLILTWAATIQVTP